MNTTARETYSPFTQWLEAATKDLCASAEARVTQEVGEHFAQRVEASVAEGMPETQAQRVALAALGSAKKSRRRYNKVYLTKNEEGVVDLLNRQSTPSDGWIERHPFIFCLLFHFLATLETLHNGNGSILTYGFIALFGAIGIYGLPLRARFPSKSVRSVLNIVTVIQILISSFLLVVYGQIVSARIPFQESESAAPFLILGLSVFLLVIVAPLMTHRIVSKLPVRDDAVKS